MAREPDRPQGRGGPGTGARDGKPRAKKGSPYRGRPGVEPRGQHRRSADGEVRVRDPRDGDSSPSDREAARPGPRPGDDLIRVAGLPSVTELFETSPERVERLYFESGLRAEVQEFCAVLGRRHKVYRQVKPDEMRRVAGTVMHGGVVALARPRQVRELDTASAAGWAGARAPLLILDGIGNPQNIGAIARTAAFFGVPRLVISDHPGQSGLSDAAYRIAKGGLERLEIYKAARLPEALRALAVHYEVVGTALGGTKSLDEIGKSGKPIALVLGNEEEGLLPATLAACTSVVTLKGIGHVQSLNVGAAAAILVHALLARRT